MTTTSLNAAPCRPMASMAVCRSFRSLVKAGDDGCGVGDIGELWVAPSTAGGIICRRWNRCGLVVQDKQGREVFQPRSISPAMHRWSGSWTANAAPVWFLNPSETPLGDLALFLTLKHRQFRRFCLMTAKTTVPMPAA